MISLPESFYADSSGFSKELQGLAAQQDKGLPPVWRAEIACDQANAESKGGWRVLICGSQTGSL